MNPITAIQLRHYISSSGWSLVSSPNDFVEVWRLTASSGAELLIPTEHAVDGPEMVEDALRRVAKHLKISESSLDDEIRQLTENVISIRVIHMDVQDGSIPLDDGIALNSNAKTLIAAAANTTLERRYKHQARPFGAVKSLLDNARLGQTSLGSYVVHVFCPDVPDDKNTPDMEVPLSFASLVTTTLQSALQGLHDAIEQYEESNNPRVFEDAYASGASANLCEAVMKFSGKNRGRTVEISLSSGKPTQLIQPTRTRVRFTPQQQNSIRAAADYFHKTYTLANEDVIGIVEGLSRPAEQEDGVIRIAATLSDSANRTVSLQLSPSEYQTAIHAHENKQLVSVRGDVVVTPRKAHLVNPSNFRIVGTRSLFDSDL